MAEMIWKSGPDGKQQRDTRAEEMEAGKKAVYLYQKLAKMEAGTKKLLAAFPRLDIGTVVNSPYNMVTVRVLPRVKLAPLDSWAVLAEDPTTLEPMMFYDPVDDYPSDLLVTRLALIA